jgi:hypothetical protein
MMVYILASVALFLAIATSLVVTDRLLRSYVIWPICVLVALGRRASSRGLYYGGRMISRGLYYGARMISRGLYHHALLGCIQYGRRVYVHAEDLVIVWPPHPGQSGALPDRTLSRPAATLAASTRMPARAFSPGRAFARPDLDELGEGGEAS